MEAPKGGDAIVNQITDLLPVGVWVARVPKGELVYANSTFTEIMGMAARSDVGVGEYAEPYGIHRTDGTLYPESELPFVRAIATKSVVVVDDIVIHRRDGRKVNIRAQARPVFDDRGEMSMVVIAFIDITREAVAEAGRLETEAKLRHALKMDSIGNLAGGIAHDFNNLLGAAQVLVQMLHRSELDAASRAYVEQLDQVIGSATQLTRSLLSFARRGETVAAPFGLNDVVRRVAALAGRTFTKSIDIRLELDADGAVVLGNPSQLEQVLMNLVVNARDAMPGGGRLEIATRCGKNQVELAVRDNGSGIPEDARDRIFEPYFTTKTSHGGTGTGIGLAVAYGIVKAHGGTIEAADAEPRGTVMRVLLPRATENLPAPRPANGTRAATTPNGLGTVLLVDDERLVLDATSRALRVLGYDVIQAATGTDAIAIYRERGGEIRGVILDMMMPDMDGAGTLAQLVAIDPAVRVLVATGGSIPEADASFGQAAGFLSKPYDLDALARGVAHLTSGHAGVLRL